MRTMQRWLVGVLGAGLLMTVPVTGSSAQGITIVGSVTDEEGMPIAGAEVRLGAKDKSVLTDEEGRFRMSGVAIGLQYIGARRIGFLPAADLVRITASDTIDFKLDRIGQRLDTVRVQRRADAAWERDLRRYEFAIDVARQGNVITDRDIEQRNALWTTDLLQTQLGFRVIGNGPTARVVSSRANCAPTIFLDGLPLVGFNPNDIMPNTIKLMVGFPNVGQLPAQLQLPSARVNPNCGVLAIFSK
ncbi:MAG: carboxypeptidase-like regulatory domain-containing protein [Gemmatimonadaceae bacterium]|jgi:hypothetical protein|nr:carboxypeptidase-like regulatory domain-containing protein [Gemmatimonadaceae bacterium]